MDPKIIDVAERAGVSAATVSRVLNGSTLVRGKTKEKVLKAIQELDYHPNAAAKNLRSQKTMTISVTVPDIKVSYYSEIIKGIENTAYARKYKVIICDVENQAAKESDYLSLLLNRTVDATIMVTPATPTQSILEIADKGYTLGVIGFSVTHPNINSVITNNVEFSVEVVQHFIDQGHRNMVYMGGYPEVIDSYERMEGYIQALKKNGIPFQPELITYGNFDEEGGYRALMRLVEQKREFTAIYAANDEMALGIYKACAELGLSIPQDVAVVGVDDERLGRYIKPTLSTIAQPKYQMGALIAQKIIDNLSSDQVHTSGIHVVPSELLARQSSLWKR